MLNLVASLLYLGTALACLRAGTAAVALDGRSKFGPLWFGAALMFVCLIAMRQLAIEDLIRADFRAMLQMHDAYGARREYQAPLAAAILVALAAAAAGGWRFRPSFGLASPADAARLAVAGIVLMLGLIALRLTSFHAIDALLYRPFHFNWLADLGSTLLVGYAALRFVRVSGRRGSVKQHKSRRN